MYDTVVIKSPAITEEIKEHVMQFCNKYEGIDIFTGEVLYTFTSGTLDGSYDYRIRMSVDDGEWVKEGNLTPVKIHSYWYLKVECSVHKLLLNHNVFGGPTDIKASIKYVVNFLEQFTCISLPCYELWEVEKIDVSRIFVFKDKSICKRIMNNFRNALYTRRKPQIYDTSFMFAGSTSTLKFYWKGPEFEKHDYKRVMKYIAKTYDHSYSVENGDLIRQKLIPLKWEFDKILDRAYRTIRYECSIKIRKLKELFNSDTVLVKMLNDTLLEGFANIELKKLIKEDEEMHTVRRSDLVRERLINLHGSTLGMTLFGTWSSLVTEGEISTKESMSRASFYRHRKLLIDAGCSWLMTNNHLKAFSVVPDDFSFLNTKYVDDSIAKEVLEKLSEVA